MPYSAGKNFFQENLTTISRTVGNEEVVLRNSSAGLHHFTKALETDSVQTRRLLDELAELLHHSPNDSESHCPE